MFLPNSHGFLSVTLLQLVCLATFLNVSESDSFDPNQELLKALIGFIDVAGLYFALTPLTHRNISQNHKFQAVGLGWAFADSVLHRLAPLWMGARGLEFTWDFILQGLESNANLVLSISLAALVIYTCAGIVSTMPSIASCLKWGLGWHFSKVVGFQLFTSLVMAFISLLHARGHPVERKLLDVEFLLQLKFRNFSFVTKSSTGYAKIHSNNSFQFEKRLNLEFRLSSCSWSPTRSKSCIVKTESRRQINYLSHLFIRLCQFE